MDLAGNFLLTECKYLEHETFQYSLFNLKFIHVTWSEWIYVGREDAGIKMKVIFPKKISGSSNKKHFKIFPL